MGVQGSDAAGNDPFENIAAMDGEGGRKGGKEGLAEGLPPVLKRRTLPLDDTMSQRPFPPRKTISTAEELRKELSLRREMSADFLRDLTPPLPAARTSIHLDSFDWRVETDSDRSDFSSVLKGRGKWEKVHIPHYSGPLGRVSTVYRTEFDVSPAMLAKGALFLCFSGVDYKAHVFLNGYHLGSHEGYFGRFEFDATRQARPGRNVLVVRVENDFTMNGSKDAPQGPTLSGDKIFACGGPGWDDPLIGWHCCPAGMGIYQDVKVEARSPIYLHDLYVRPLNEQGDAEARIELAGSDTPSRAAALRLSVVPQNFTEGEAIRLNLPCDKTEGGVRRFVIPFKIPRPRLWTPETPWLYQARVEVLDGEGKVIDAMKRQFGMRTFRMDQVNVPKGRMYLNGHAIKLRGANTMGAFQQCVIRRDWRQLIDDILLAKITGLNYVRLTQTPVQSEIYDYCDRLGLMLQTDLPLFGQLRRSGVAEALRQAGEMECLVRSHPSNILDTYINEPFPEGNHDPRRNLTRDELNRFFEAADFMVHLANPDRVTKAVDGDYDPPGPGLPDNHCYPLWYNGHAIDAGKLIKGYWVGTKDGWMHGCGEFGSEGLDSVDLMRRRYPSEWLPATPAEEGKWNPSRIPMAQTGKMHADFFETPRSLEDWVERSRSYQAWVTRTMTEAFRRDPGMQGFAIHLFIDAFPDGWMKSIMDCERTPKPAWFAYHEALAPLAVSLRSDRRAFFSGEPMRIEAWVCNDLGDAPPGAMLLYQLERDGKILASGRTGADVGSNSPVYQGDLPFVAPSVEGRSTVTVRLGLVDHAGRLLHDVSEHFDVFGRQEVQAPRRILVLGKRDGRAARLAGELGCRTEFNAEPRAGDTVLIDDPVEFEKRREALTAVVRQGAKAVFLELPKGTYRIGGGQVGVDDLKRGLYFVSRDTGDPMVAGFGPDDFRFWYDATLDRPAPLMKAGPFNAGGWKPILLRGTSMAAGWKPDGKGAWCVVQIELAGRIAGNPVAEIFARRLLSDEGLK